MLVRKQMTRAPQGCDRARVEHESANQNSAHSSTQVSSVRAFTKCTVHYTTVDDQHERIAHVFNESKESESTNHRKNHSRHRRFSQQRQHCTKSVPTKSVSESRIEVPTCSKTTNDVESYPSLTRTAIVITTQRTRIPRCSEDDQRSNQHERHVVTKHSCSKGHS
jgi:hypothetical protein